MGEATNDAVRTGATVDVVDAIVDVVVVDEVVWVTTTVPGPAWTAPGPTGVEFSQAMDNAAITGTVSSSLRISKVIEL
jgi:hypothetical protein